VNGGARARRCTGVYNVIAPSLPGTLSKRRSTRLTQATPNSSPPSYTHVLCRIRTHASLFSFSIAYTTHCDSHRSVIPCLLQT
jgi:hypothetical protein